VIFQTDGRSATQRAAETGIANLVLIDLALDYTQATRLAVSVAHCFAPAAAAAVGLLQAAGFAVSRFADVPGLAVMRTVAMLANEAADAVNQGVCDARAPTRRCASASITPGAAGLGRRRRRPGDLPGAAQPRRLLRRRPLPRLAADPAVGLCRKGHP
jgi:hypothetical protein